MEELYPKRNILAIDLKSFFASCECVERKLDPYKVPLIVCDPTRNGAITLAVTPFLKKFGVPGRCRVFELYKYNLPKNIKIIKAPPRMSLYIAKSKEVLSIYLEFVSHEDMHVYSIDEVFLDVTDYLKMYKMTDYELAKTIMQRIKDKTGLTATAGIGPNLLLAKVAMDIEAKHTKDNIAKWTYEDIPNKLWPITPLSKMWGIGPCMERNLNKLKLYKIEDIAKYDKNILKDKYGVMGEELWNHANGIDLSKISDFNNVIPKDKSISHSQILFKDYNEENITLIIKEMIDVLTFSLRNKHKLTRLIGFGIGYSKEETGGFYHSIKLEIGTDSKELIYKYALMIFDKYYEENMPIRKVSIVLGNLEKKESRQLSFFDETNLEKKENINNALDDVKKKYGKNSILNASSLLKDSTIIERNKKIGGHSA